MYIFALLILIIINFRKYTNDELNLEKLQRRNILLAMRKQQHKLEYGEAEITPAEEVTMRSTQY